MENFDNYKKIVNEHLDKFLEIQYPHRIWESMRYSVLADGKRLRPVLTLEACRICGGDINNAVATACAIEMLHAQSLIHDDLPCIDNDDLRRGRPTNHKAFDEATAVLAGDALLSFAPQVIIQKTPKSVSCEVKIEVLEQFLTAAGALKLIAGQVVDIESENKKISKETLDFIHNNKTSALFELSLFCGAKLANANQTQIDILQKYAKNLGLAFQISDDIIDITSSTQELGKTAGKDQQAGKQTYPELYGLEESKQKVRELCFEAKEIILNNGLESSLLSSILDIIEKRIKNNV
jgi:geranylgeranyl diphosphate synthase type II